MSTHTESHHRTTSEAWLVRLLIGGAVACLIGAGGILWWRQGGAVFNDMVLAALAWCF
ncbi:hypothetical protein [Microvirga brassicacearum]|jgi:hypothetical protein|uniref:hypothetical protein n=1 Tax=Microvirga brassicacearum TaxID=2580413 RepID=UPI001292F88E|nr:hypothetical protein [Microvirga brassicacearum]